MKTYYLFLDESKPNGNNINHLVVAGAIIEKKIYEHQIIKRVNQLKQDIFDGTGVILHENEIINSKDDFTILRKKEIRDQFWNELKNIYNCGHITTLGAAVNITEYKRIYPNLHLNDEYFIAIQILLENFVHFLESTNSYGAIYLESRNPSEDKKIRSIYHKICANGTLYFNESIFQERLTNINFLIKADNNIGLQLADFVPGCLNRKCNNLKPRPYSLIEEINDTLYTGKHNLPERFGVKIMP